jgi:hypothetical protein
MAVGRNCVDRALALLRGLPRVSLANLKDADFRKKVRNIILSMEVEITLKYLSEK